MKSFLIYVRRGGSRGLWTSLHTSTTVAAGMAMGSKYSALKRSSLGTRQITSASNRPRISKSGRLRLRKRRVFPNAKNF